MKGFILTLLLAYGGAVAALFQPLIGIVVYAIFSTARPQVMFGWAGDLTGVSQIVGIATLAGWMLKGFGDWRLGRAWGPLGLLLGFMFFAALSAVFASNQTLAWAYVIERLKIVVIFLAGITLLDSEVWIRRLAWSLVLAQGYIAFEMNLSYLEGYNRAAAEGLLGDNNSFAISMVAALGPAVFLGFAAREWWKKALAFGSAALVLHTVLLTFSRGGILSLIITGMLVVMLMPKRPSLLLAVLVTALLTARLMGPEVTERFMTTFASEEERDGSAESRLLLWKDCFVLIQESPIVGVGPSNFQVVAPRFGWPEGKSAHSLWVQTAAEVGVPGTLCLLGFYLLTLARGMGLARRHARTGVGVHGLYVFSGLIGFVISAQFVSIEGLELPYFIALMGAATTKLHEASTEAAHVPSAPMVDAMNWRSRNSLSA